MRRLAEIVVRHRLAVLAAAGLLCAWAAVSLRTLRRESDLLEFMPPDDPRVVRFRALAARFGGLDVALVGVQADDVYRPAVLSALAGATDRVRSVRGIDGVLSLTVLPDAVASEDGLTVRPLVELPPPRDPDAIAALRARVARHPEAVGTVVSEDGRAALILAFLAVGADSREVAPAVRAAAEAALPGLPLSFGGAPFVGDEVASGAERDLRNLVPLVALAIVAVLLAAFRDPLGIALALAAVLAGAAASFGAMAAAGDPFTLVSGALAVVLLACGIGCPLHVLAAYDAARATLPPEAAAVAAVERAGRPVAAAGLTSACGFLSFLAMDAEPMRDFGRYAALGILVTLVLSLTAVPAGLALKRPAPPRPPRRPRALVAAVGSIARAGARRPAAALSAAAALAAAAAVLVPGIRTDVATAHFFPPESDAYRSEALLSERFGGSQFVQVHVRGDLTDPLVLREVERVAAAARALPGVTGVRSIVDALKLVGDAMGVGRRLPDTAAQARNLYFFLEGEPTLGQLVTPDRREALVHVKVRGIGGDEVGEVVGRLEALAREPRRLRGADPRSDAAARRALAEEVAGAIGRPDAAAELARAIGRPAGVSPAEAARDHLASPVAAVSLAAAGIERVAQAAAGGEVALRAALRAQAPDEPGDAIDAALAGIRERRGSLGRERAIDALAVKLGVTGGSVRERLRDLWRPAIGVPDPAGPTEVALAVTGTPSIHHALSDSVERGLTRAGLIGLALVAAVIALVYRSATVGVLTVLPAAVATLAVFGGMRALGIALDLGTAMVASLSLGAGVDQACHLVWHMRPPAGAAGEPPGSRAGAAERASATAGPAIAAGTAMVAAGFGILACGETLPMRHFGGLTAASMVLGALASLLLVPALVAPVRLRALPASAGTDAAAADAAGPDAGRAAGDEDALGAR